MITQDELKKLLDYNPETGIFTNKVTRNSRAVKDRELNPSNEGRYGVVQINKQKYLLHRLAWFYTYGTWPKDQIDHINRNTRDNSIVNLRECTQQQNTYNTIGKNKTSKYKGVHRHGNKWRAKITVQGKQIILGSFEKEIDAANAYNKQAELIHGEFAVLNNIESLSEWLSN